MNFLEEWEESASLPSSSHPPKAQAASTSSTAESSSNLEDAARRRKIAKMLEQSAAQHRSLAALTLDDTERASMLASALSLQQQAEQHRVGAAAPPAAAPAAESASREEGDSIRPLLTTVGAATLWALPGGLVTGAAVIAAAPHLGIDFDGKASRPIRATLRRDFAGRFNFMLKEDADGLFVAVLLESEAIIPDDRSSLLVGDRVRSLDDQLVRAAASARRAAPSMSAAEPPHEAQEGMGLEEAKAHVRAVCYRRSTSDP